MKRKLSSLIAAVFIGIGAFSCICQAAGMDIDKEDGEYSIQVDLEGGSGKASVTSPTILTVKDGHAYAQIQWSSSNYDYMIVDGEKYLPTNEEGMNSVFEIGEKIVFIHEGRKEWEGDKNMIAHSDNKYLNDFIFSSELYKKIKNAL